MQHNHFKMRETELTSVSEILSGTELVYFDAGGIGYGASAFKDCSSPGLYCLTGLTAP